MFCGALLVVSVGKPHIDGMNCCLSFIRHHSGFFFFAMAPEKMHQEAFLSSLHMLFNLFTRQAVWRQRAVDATNTRLSHTHYRSAPQNLKFRQIQALNTMFTLQK
jgi:hypothetical protein